MDIKDVPDTSTVGPVDFRPFMIEVAWNYCQLVLGSTIQRGMIEQHSVHSPLKLSSRVITLPYPTTQENSTRPMSSNSQQVFVKVKMRTI